VIGFTSCRLAGCWVREQGGLPRRRVTPTALTPIGRCTSAASWKPPEFPWTINFAAPAEFGGEPGLWTPENPLLGAVMSRYVATFLAIAEASKLFFSGMDVFVKGGIEKQEGGFRFTRILRPVLHDRSGKRIARYSEAHRNGAERACLISRSLSCATSVEATIRLENQSPRNRFTLLACGRADSQLSYGCSPAFSFLSSGSD